MNREFNSKFNLLYGIVNADDTICFEQKCDDFATYCAGKSEKFLKYFEDRLKTQIKG